MRISCSFWANYDADGDRDDYYDDFDVDDDKDDHRMMVLLEGNHRLSAGRTQKGARLSAPFGHHRFHYQCVDDHHCDHDGQFNAS